MQSLQDWNPDNPGMLTAVVKEVITQYKQHQYHLIERYSKKVQFEYESLQQLDILKNTEVFLQRNAQVDVGIILLYCACTVITARITTSVFYYNFEYIF